MSDADAVNNDSRRLDELAAEIDEVGQKASRVVELGRRGFTIALCTFALIVGQLLPWVGDNVGWQVLVGQGGGAIPQLFAVTSTAIGVLGSALALATRRWVFAWACAIGGWFASVDGVLAIWSQQSSHANGAVGAGPGIGLIIAWIATIFLAVQWMRTAWSRT
jgi:hypothetical protein